MVWPSGDKAGRPAAKPSRERKVAELVLADVVGFTGRLVEECWRQPFARSLVPKLGGLKRDPEYYLTFYAADRAHAGRYTQGRTPRQTLAGARIVEPS